jgi:hypothetical protein
MQFWREDIVMLPKLSRSDKEKNVYSETEQKNSDQSTGNIYGFLVKKKLVSAGDRKL